MLNHVANPRNNRVQLDERAFKCLMEYLRLPKAVNYHMALDNNDGKKAFLSTLITYNLPGNSKFHSIDHRSDGSFLRTRL